MGARSRCSTIRKKSKEVVNIKMKTVLTYLTNRGIPSFRTLSGGALGEA